LIRLEKNFLIEILLLSEKELERRDQKNLKENRAVLKHERRLRKVFQRIVPSQTLAVEMREQQHDDDDDSRNPWIVMMVQTTHDGQTWMDGDGDDSQGMRQSRQ
jgi:hypothetical protein